MSANNADALNNKSVVFANLGNYYGAIKYIDKALAIDRNDATALDNKRKILGALEK